jgi:hypothetical protein
MWADDEKGAWFEPRGEAPKGVVGRNGTGQPCGHSLRESRTFPTLDHIEIMNLIDILTLVAAWRLVICCLAGGLFAYGLHQIVPALTFFHLIGVTTLGLVAGVEWQSLSMPRQWANGTPNFEIHPAPMGLLAAVAGAFWGFFNAASLQDFIIGFLLFLISVIAWRRFFLREGLETHIANQCAAISCAALFFGAGLARTVL